VRREPGKARERRSMERLLIPVATCVVLATVTWVIAVMLLDFPTVVVCERGPTTPNVEVSSTRIHGFYDGYRVGPCVAYIHRSTDPSGD
jgi:hypothetical protein